MDVMVEGDGMTYRYYKEDGWIGYCDSCSKPFKPLYVFISRENVSLCGKDDYKAKYIDNFENFSDKEFSGRCLDCDRRMFFRTLDGNPVGDAVSVCEGKLYYGKFRCVIIAGIIVI
jgi:hypothetical protein